MLLTQISRKSDGEYGLHIFLNSNSLKVMNIFWFYSLLP